MTTFIASKFNPENDEDKPVVGSIIHANNEAWKIMEVSWATASAVLKDSQKNPPELMALNGFDECFARPHTDRPFVQWLVWANRIPQG